MTIHDARARLLQPDPAFSPAPIWWWSGEPLVLGGLGTNYLPNSVTVRRGHVACVNRWRKRILAGLRKGAK